MDTQTYDEAINMAEARQHLYIATADENGYPHLSSAGSFVPLSRKRVEVGDCFCPTLLRNLTQNSRVSLVVWDIATDVGYQFLGEVEAAATPEGILISGSDINSIGLEGDVIRIRVDRVMRYSHAPHSDEAPVRAASAPVVATRAV